MLKNNRAATHREPIRIGKLLRAATLPNYVPLRVYTPFHEEGDISAGQKAGEAIANAFIVIGVVLVLTIFLVVLYKFRCYCVSIVFCWLRNEISGNPISHKELGANVWDGRQGHKLLDWQFLLPSL